MVGVGGRRASVKADLASSCASFVAVPSEMSASLRGSSRVIRGRSPLSVMANVEWVSSRKDLRGTKREEGSRGFAYADLVGACVYRGSCYRGRARNRQKWDRNRKV